MCLAIPGKILEIHGDDSLSRVGKIDFGGIRKEASLACLPEAKVGDYAIVHAGFALSLVDESEAEKIFDYLREIEELGEMQPPNGTLPSATSREENTAPPPNEVPG